MELLTLLGFCAFLFFFGLGDFGLVGADEPHFEALKPLFETILHQLPAPTGDPDADYDTYKQHL